MDVKEQLEELEKKIAEGLDRAFVKMLAFKKQKGTPVVISRGGKVVEVSPEELEETP